MAGSPGRVFRLADGTHVLEGDVQPDDVAFLAYREGDKLPKPVADELAGGRKQSQPAADKQVTAHQDKSAGRQGFRTANVDSHACDVCGDSFSTERGLNIHKGAKH